MPKLSRPSVKMNHDGDHNTALIERQQNTDKIKDIHKSYTFLTTGSF